MRLFRKPGGNNAAKGKKIKQEEGNQYEYVRKEYGFDYVPPSQYVPSRSMSDDDDDDDDADEETIEVQYQGAAPVKIIQPRSEISGSIAEEIEDDDLSPPKPPKHFGKKSRNAPREPEYRKEKKTYRTKKTPSPVPIVPEGLEEPLPDYLDEDRYHKDHYRSREPEPRRHKQKIYRSDDVGGGDRRIPRKHLKRDAREVGGEDEYPLARRDRHRSEPRPAREVYREDIEENIAPRRRSFHHENSRDDELDDLDIGRVHTAYSYNSDDSAESFIEEQSRGSRYTSKERKKKVSRGLSKKKTPRENRILENDLMDRVVVRSGTWRKTRKGWELEEEKDAAVVYRDRDGVMSRRIEEYEEPRYDRKNVAMREENRQDTPKEYRRSIYDGHERRMSHLGQRKPRHYRKPAEIEESRDVPEEIREEDLAFDRDCDLKDVYSRKRNQARTEASYYATPSGRVASDYELTEPFEKPRLGRKKSTRGFLGRIRESVRGPTRKESSRSIPFEREVNVSDQHGEMYRRKPCTLFEQVPPSMQSDVSYEYRRSRDFHHKEPDVPSTMPRKHAPAYPARKSYEYDPQPRYKDYDEAEYQVRRRPSYRQEREAPPKPPRRVEGDEYWEIPAVRERAPSPAMLFESTRTDTPALRANLDHRRTSSRHHSKGVHDHYHTTPMADDRGRHNNLPEHSRYMPLTSPKLVRHHPHIHDPVQPKQGKGLGLGCY